MAIGRCWSAYTRARTYDKPLIFAGVAAGIALLTGGITFDAWTFDQFLPTSLILMGLGTGTARTVEARTPTTRPVPAARQRAASTVGWHGSHPSPSPDTTPTRGCGGWPSRWPRRATR